MNSVESKIKWIQKNIEKDEELLVRTNQDEDDKNIWFVHYSSLICNNNNCILSVKSIYKKYGDNLDSMLDDVINLINANI